ncbi:MAG: phosphate ABC transporter ATP-binding protein [Mesoaciditoga sp.]|uniref:phosphate ABC transporter ATP-binding protein PstB n=1 Tax=Athalassotoga sp. TaxID=2022597 RepID=UPI000CBF4265|nr:MAG: phosphate ABC transporter ATP-binding protein [Mesoaciditoga sp.]PMP79683.1 MAG: phosphate ABC transporter ATP-binding protein [Mesoaciditoga sp.]HEU24348.1 phosphate ABC transporter ATP-binding protein [Mesoaciditoga lauensis]
MDIDLKVKNLSAYFGQKKILDSISLEIPSRSIVAIIGPSGCGKSTFLRTINRMNDRFDDFHSTGSIIFKGRDTMEYPVEELRKEIGMVFQKPNPFPKSIYENVVFGLKIQGIRDKKILDEKANQSLMAASLYEEVKDRLSTNAYKLSGGQQQRLCIARALAVSPKILLLDEPTSAIDPIATKQIENVLKNIKKDITIVIVTHNINQAARIADYVAFFYMGRLIEFGKSEKVLNSPAEKLTEEYLTGTYG